MGSPSLFLRSGVMTDDPIVTLNLFQGPWHWAAAVPWMLKQVQHDGCDRVDVVKLGG
jgi:hypothetical protein